MTWRRATSCWRCTVLLVGQLPSAQAPPRGPLAEPLWAGLAWRTLGPMRGGRTVAAATKQGGGASGCDVSATPSATSASVAAAPAILSAALGSVDVQPTANQLTATATTRTSAAGLLAKWKTGSTQKLPALHTRLKAAGVDTILGPPRERLTCRS